MRFLKELKNPKLKCERVGHKNRLVWREGYIKPNFNDFNWSYTVVNAVHQERRCCTRCGDADDWVTTKRQGIQRFTAAPAIWAQIDLGNYFPYRGWRAYDPNEVLRKAF